MKTRRASAFLEKPDKIQLRLEGVVGERLRANVDNWLLPAPKSNPAMLQMFRDRDRKPRRKLCPWAGEFAGKYLISAVQAARLTSDERLFKLVDEFVRELIAAQDDDGYLGPYPRDQRFFGTALDGIHDGGPLWDVWGHYHAMLGLLLWYRDTGCQPALDACRKAADLICRTFLDANVPILATHSPENNGALHVFPLLYQQTGEPRYLQLAQKIVKDWEAPGGIDYLRSALAGKEFHKFPWPRWEGLHAVQGLAELYLATGDDGYRQAFVQVWQSILKLDRHNTGGFSSNEGAVGNPYDPRAIETCCTVAWVALTIDMLRLTGNSLVADELELATFNAVLGSQHPSGRWWTYNTPMDGERQAFIHTVRAQLQVGGHELGCCTVNGPRGLGMISEWAVMAAGDGVAINHYGPGAITFADKSGQTIRFVQETDYPADGRIMLKVYPPDQQRFVLRLRIPGWSRNTVVAVNGEDVGDVKARTYLALDRVWKAGDTVQISLDMSCHYWIGERECAGKTSIYYGPILLAYDRYYNTMDPDDVPALDARRVNWRRVAWDKAVKPWLLFRCEALAGRELHLCDFASAGAAGTPYRSWLRVLNSTPPATDIGH